MSYTYINQRSYIYTPTKFLIVHFNSRFYLTVSPVTPGTPVQSKIHRPIKSLLGPPQGSPAPSIGKLGIKIIFLAEKFYIFHFKSIFFALPKQMQPEKLFMQIPIFPHVIRGKTTYSYLHNFFIRNVFALPINPCKPEYYTIIQKKSSPKSDILSDKKTIRLKINSIFVDGLKILSP